MARLVRRMNARENRPAHGDPRSIVLQLLGVFAAPAAWALQLILNYALATYPCMPHNTPFRYLPASWSWDRPVLFAINLLALVLALASGWLSLSLLRRVQKEPEPGDEQTEIGQQRSIFMAASGVFTGFGFAAAIAFNTIDLIGVPQCSG